MALKQRLDHRQVQKLILAPALQQAIKLLPLTNLELVEVIDEELSANPLLELEEESPPVKGTEDQPAAAGTDTTSTLPYPSHAGSSTSTAPTTTVTVGAPPKCRAAAPLASGTPTPPICAT